MKRQEQRVENTWRLEDLYENEVLFSQDAEKLDAWMEQFAELQGTLQDGAEALEKALKLYEEMNQLFEKLYVYANQRNHEDTANAKYQKMSGETQIMAAKMNQVTSWLEPEILMLDEGTLKNEVDQVPELKKYDWFLKQIIRKKAHILDPEKEELLQKQENWLRLHPMCLPCSIMQILHFQRLQMKRGRKRSLQSEPIFPIWKAGIVR